MELNNPYQAPVASPLAGGGGGGTAGIYEFDVIQNATIEKAAKRTRLWGIVSLVFGTIGLVLSIAFGFWTFTSGLMADLGQQGAVITAAIFGFLAPMALVYAVVGKLYIDSGNALEAVVTSSGNDVLHLMRALDKMANAFRLEVIMSAIGFVLGLVLGVVAGAGAMELGS